MKTITKLMTLSISSLLSMNIGFSTTDQLEEGEILSHSFSNLRVVQAERPATNIYADELNNLVKKRAEIVGKYALDNLWRITFNGFKTADEVIHEGISYHIAGLRTADGEQAEIIRQQMIENLPNDRAYLTNRIGGLYVKGSNVDKDHYVQINYGYKPGPLDRSGIAEYSFNVESKMTFLDQSDYTKCSKQIGELQKYMALDKQDRREEAPVTATIWDMTQEAVNYSDKLRFQAQDNVLQCLADYQELRFSRLMLLANYHILQEESHKTMLRSFNTQVLQYRQYLVDTAEKLSTLSEDAKFADTLRELQSNTKRFSEPLRKFPAWFNTKDETAPEYNFYKSWK